MWLHDTETQYLHLFYELRWQNMSEAAAESAWSGCRKKKATLCCPAPRFVSACVFVVLSRCNLWCWMSHVTLIDTVLWSERRFHVTTGTRLSVTPRHVPVLDLRRHLPGWFSLSGDPPSAAATPDPWLFPQPCPTVHIRKSGDAIFIFRHFMHFRLRRYLIAGETVVVAGGVHAGTLLSAAAA